MKKILIISTLTLVLALSGCGTNNVPAVNDEILEEHIEETQTEAQSIVVDTLVIAKVENGVILDIKVPQIKGMKNIEKQNEINNMFIEKGEALKKEAIKAEEGLRGIEESSLHGEGISTFDTKLLNDNVLSIVLENYIYTGGAHGMTYRVPLNIDIKEEKVISLKDMFKEEADYVEIVSNEIKRQIEDNELDFPFFEPFKQIKQDQDFYITENDIVVYFGVYEYTPYAAGFPEFPIERSTLTSLRDKYK